MTPNDAAQQLIVHRAVERVEARNPDWSIDVLRAAKAREDGLKAYQSGRHTETLRLFETALSALHNVPGVEAFRSLICSQMMWVNIVLKRYPEAIALGPKAIVGLEDDPRWAPCLAYCCTNFAAALASDGRAGEAIPYLERALELFRQIPGSGNQVRVCRQDLDTLRQATAADQPRASWWARLFGG